MAKLPVCIFLMLVLLVAASESGPMKSCCTEYQVKPVPVKVLKYYKVQDARDVCNIKAIIFKTNKNRVFCANPGSKWVRDAMKLVPQKL